MSSNGADAAMEHQPNTYRALERPRGTVRALNRASLEAHLSPFRGTWLVLQDGDVLTATAAPATSAATNDDSTIIRYISA